MFLTENDCYIGCAVVISIRTNQPEAQIRFAEFTATPSGQERNVTINKKI